MERNYTFWILYVIDKTISLTMGQSYCLPMYDCDVSSPTPNSAIHLHDHLLARIELAAIQEDTYHFLYSSRTCQQEDCKGSSIDVSQLNHKLTLWASKYKYLREDTRKDTSSSSSFQSCRSMALCYHFYMTRIMVHRTSKVQLDMRQCRSDARACIGLLQCLGADDAPVSSAVMLRQCVFPFYDDGGQITLADLLI